MNRTGTLTIQEAHHKAQAQSYLAETRRILRQLSAERQREKVRRGDQPNILAEVRAILRRA